MDLLTLLIVVPAAATGVMFFLPEKQRTAITLVPVLASAICLGISSWLFWTALQEHPP